MGYIFISYSHKDQEYVHKLADALQAAGFEVWIDDRIDYGTRWPLVIETAIDSCESFILVATENSHQSQWVQHEVARAERLDKQIFPLLLSGDPWISFESIQYFDVRDGDMPNQRFYDTLIKAENRRFEYFRRAIAHVWPIYRNKEYRFSLSYPPNGDLLVRQSGSVQIDLPVLKGTNLEQKYLQINFGKDGNLSSPLIKDLAWIHKSTYIDILGLRFLKESGDEAGMSRFHEWISYSTSQQSKVVTVSLYLSSVFPGVFTPGMVTHVDLAAEKEILLYVVSAFTWLG